MQRMANVDDPNNTMALLGGEPTNKEAILTDWPIVDVEETTRGLKAVLLSGNFGSSEGNTSAMVRQFEESFARYVGCKHALMTNSGTAALQLAVAAAGLRANDEVLVPALSWIATPLSILNYGCIPIFVDVDRTGGIDFNLLQANMGPRTRAVMAVHLHGNPVDMDALGKAAKNLGLILIEDAAQAAGAMWRGKTIGGVRARHDSPILAAFSLQQSKNLPAGEGGVFVTDDDQSAQRAAAYRSFGLSCSGDALLSVVPRGMHRSNELAAVFALPQLGQSLRLLSAC